MRGDRVKKQPVGMHGSELEHAMGAMAEPGASGSLTEFLLARIAEDEAWASKATAGRWKLWGMSVMADTQGDSDVNHATPVADTHWPERPRTWNADHIARWDPERVLAECAAKRAIVGLWSMPDPHTPAELQEATCQECEAMYVLAAVYSDHTDYRQEWAL